MEAPVASWQPSTPAQPLRSAPPSDGLPHQRLRLPPQHLTADQGVVVINPLLVLPLLLVVVVVVVALLVLMLVLGQLMRWQADGGDKQLQGM